MENFDLRTHLQMEDLSDESFLSSDSEVEMEEARLVLEDEAREDCPVWSELEKGVEDADWSSVLNLSDCESTGDISDEAMEPETKAEADANKGKCEVVVIQSRQLPMQNSCAVEITWEKLEQHFHESLPVAASKLGIGKSTMKLVCRKLGLVKWPYKNKGGKQVHPQGGRKISNVGFGHPLRYNHVWRSFHDYQLSVSLHPLGDRPLFRG
uniref:RWP-RK domain-containing protein n=1 Tax=Hanusia phi TaxID=3032 RepID=A0A7S0DXM2_9CRYP|mmetsp:Transcript_1251/g.2708  ORF Transcript_1251/g.2708 Transcript_1251/m.2708 type:complete len:210 (+) Transcript_1251:251-880(+)